MAKLGPAGAPGSRRERTYHIIFQTEDGWARVFDMVLIVAILASVAIVMLDSVAGIVRAYGVRCERPSGSSRSSSPSSTASASGASTASARTH